MHPCSVPPVLLWSLPLNPSPRLSWQADREDNDGGRAPSFAHDRAPANSTGGLATGRSAAEAVAEAARLSQSVTVYRCDVCQVTTGQRHSICPPRILSPFQNAAWYLSRDHLLDTRFIDGGSTTTLFWGHGDRCTVLRVQALVHCCCCCCCCCCCSWASQLTRRCASSSLPCSGHLQGRVTVPHAHGQRHASQSRRKARGGPA